MTVTAQADAAERWRHDLAAAFGQLQPQAVGEVTPVGSMAGGSVSGVAAYEISGRPQVVRRSVAAVRRHPSDLLKVCLPTAGRATVHQGGREVRVGPGELAIYDTGRVYDLLLEGDWSCAVLAVPRASLGLPDATVAGWLGHGHVASSGPGATLGPFVATTVRLEPTLVGPARRRFAEVGLELLLATLGRSSGAASTARRHGLEPDDDVAAQARRLTVLSYLHSHLADPCLTHDSVAAAHHLSPRSLHRLFETEPMTVTQHIRSARLRAVRTDLTSRQYGHRTISAIGAQWCFVDPAHLSRAFQAEFGVPPSAVRRAGPHGG